MRPPFAGIMPDEPWKPPSACFSRVGIPCAMRGAHALVADPRRARDPGAMAGDTGGLEDRLAVRQLHLARGGRASNRGGGLLDREGRIVRTGDGHLAERADALLSGSLHQGVAGVPGTLGAAVHEAGNADEEERDRDQDAEYRAENVDEMPIVLCHARIIASGPPDH